MTTESRRRFLLASGTLLAGTTGLGSLTAGAATGHHHHGSGDGMKISATKKDTCATCKFWGGMRKISDDNSNVIAQSMGWCNNPDSPNHQKLTSADHNMKKPGVWKKWTAL